MVNEFPIIFNNDADNSFIFINISLSDEYDHLIQSTY